MELARSLLVFVLTEVLYAGAFYFFWRSILDAAYPRATNKKRAKLREQYGKMRPVCYWACWKLCRQTPQNKPLVILYCGLSFFMLLCGTVQALVLVGMIVSGNISRGVAVLAEFWQWTFLGALAVFAILGISFDAEWQQHYLRGRSVPTGQSRKRKQRPAKKTGDPDKPE